MKKVTGEKAVKEKAVKKAIKGEVVKRKTATGVREKMLWAKPGMMALQEIK